MRTSRYEIDQRLCRRCGSCLRACPVGAVRESEDKRLVINQKCCDGCGACQKACKLRAVVKRRGLFW